MGQKTHPVGFRLGVIRDWHSKWYEDKAYGQWLHEDLAIRKMVKERLYGAGISKVDIERAAGKVKLSIHTPRPGIVIGKKGVGIESLKQDLQKLSSYELFVNIHEVRKAEIDAQLVAENVASQLERRVAFRRAMKKAVQTALKFGAKGIRIGCRGVSAALKCLDTNGTVKAECLFTRFVQTSITALQNRRQLTGSSALSAGSSKAKFWAEE